MSRFEVKFELTGLKLEIKGSREDVPAITQAVGQQLVGMLAPAANIVEGDVIDVPFKSVEPPAIEQKNSKKRHGRSRSKTAVSKTSEKAEDKPLDWRHDPAKWGSPQQDWVTADKAVWLLYVMSKELNVLDMNARIIANTFNKHFRQAGQLLVCNVNRDLGKLKGKPQSMVAEDTTKEIPAWFLTDTGISHAHQLVSKALGIVRGS